MISESAFAPSELRRDRDTILGLAENRISGCGAAW
jgi:hypothetical protein